jgi:3-hydroxymyristoyl/3-hydroxydecanoyl-(acyl carrier protein) dehydratase
MPETDLYKLTQSAFPPVISRIGAESQLSLLLEISTDLGWFHGHFPGQPILAGVVQLHWAVTVARTNFNLDHGPLDVSRLKFKNVVLPPTILELALHRVAANEVHFTFSSFSNQHSEGRLKFPGGTASSRAHQ